jgi:hypothetical protein
MRRALLYFSVVGLALTARAANDPPDGGAQVSVQVDANGDTTVDVKRGNLKVKTDGHETRVGAGETVRVQKGKPLKKLIAAPEPLAPADGATLGTVDVGFAWRKVPGATRYVLELSAAPEMTATRSQTLETLRGSVHLEAGTWYWRVVALDASGIPGKRQTPRRLTIDTTPPKLKTGKPEWR